MAVDGREGAFLLDLRPLVAGNAIAIMLAMDLTMKGRGRTQLTELCVYASLFRPGY